MPYVARKKVKFRGKLYRAGEYIGERVLRSYLKRRQVKWVDTIEKEALTSDIAPSPLPQCEEKEIAPSEPRIVAQPVEPIPEPKKETAPIAVNQKKRGRPRKG